jgi:hypothetical protein
MMQSRVFLVYHSNVRPLNIKKRMVVGLSHQKTSALQPSSTRKVRTLPQTG